MSIHSHGKASFVVLAVAMASTSGLAQCAPTWQATGAVPAPGRGEIQTAILWDHDGNPASARLLAIGGTFTITGVGAVNVATLDLATGRWAALGSGTNGIVYSLVAGPTGDLFAGGWFAAAGTAPANNVARWDGAAWQPLGAGVTGTYQAQVRALVCLPSGDLIAGGLFTHAGGLPCLNVARWDGAQWQPLGAGYADGAIAMLLHPNGDLFVHGGGWPGSVGRWDGNTWTNLISVACLARGDLAVAANGNLLVTGVFATPSGPTNNIARWNGTTWAPMAPGTDWMVNALEVLPNGDVVAAGDFTAPGTNCQRWDGTQWLPLANGTGGTIHTLLRLPDGRLLAAGAEGGTGPWVGSLKAFDGSAWQVLGTGFNDRVRCLAVLPSGAVVAGGDFTHAGGDARRFVATMDGLAAQAMPMLQAPATALCTLANGRVLATGYAGGRLAYWTGTTWNPVGTGFSSAEANALVELRDGTIVVALPWETAMRHLLAWNGTTWSWLGGLQPNHAVEALLVSSNGDLVAGGAFTAMGTLPIERIGVWDGSTWSALPGIADGRVHSLAELPDGDLVAGGDFTVASGQAVHGIARWTGSTWLPLGQGFGHQTGNARVEALLTLPNGDLIAGGSFTTAGGVPAAGIARWDGTGWSPVGQGVDGVVLALALTPDGTIVVGGEFTSAGGRNSAYFARLVTPCPASAQSTPSGCPANLDPPRLRALTFPWLGADYVAECDLRSTAVFAVEAMGFTMPGLPMNLLHPGSSPECLLLSSGELIAVAAHAAGVATTRVHLPRHSALVGVRLHQQFVRVRFDATGALLPLVGSNALTLVAGALD